LSLSINYDTNRPYLFIQLAQNEKRVPSEPKWVNLWQFTAAEKYYELEARREAEATAQARIAALKAAKAEVESSEG
jgi:hypothetical protein